MAKGKHKKLSRAKRRLAILFGMVDPVRCRRCGHVFDKANAKKSAKHNH